MATKFARSHRRTPQYSKQTISTIQRILCAIAALCITYVLAMATAMFYRDLQYHKALVSYYRDSCNKRGQLVATTLDVQTGRITCTYRNQAKDIFAASNEEAYLKSLHKQKKHN